MELGPIVFGISYVVLVVEGLPIGDDSVAWVFDGSELTGHYLRG